MRPLVLLSNDDGVAAPNLAALRAALLPLADVVVCAPELNQSATSHSLSLHRILRLREVEPGVFAVDGTPADCLYTALHSGTRILPRRPDLIVSGMNHGLNLDGEACARGEDCHNRSKPAQPVSVTMTGHTADLPGWYDYPATIAVHSNLVPLTPTGKSTKGLDGFVNDRLEGHAPTTIEDVADGLVDD